MANISLGGSFSLQVENGVAKIVEAYVVTLTADQLDRPDDDPRRVRWRSTTSFDVDEGLYSIVSGITEIPLEEIERAVGPIEKLS